MAAQSIKFTGSAYVNRKGDARFGIQLSVTDLPALIAGDPRALAALAAAADKVFTPENIAQTGIADPRKPARRPRATRTVEVIQADEPAAKVDTRTAAQRKADKERMAKVRAARGTRRTELPAVEAPATVARPRTRGRVARAGR